ncbi:MAG: M28 family peptidase, partial [Gemmatimonadales bacterium]
SHVGEEKGLLGSRWFVDHPTVPLDSIVAAHNMDMLGKGRVTDVRFGGPNSVQMLGSRRLSAQFGELVDSVNAVRSEPMVIDYSWDRTNALNRFCRSDQVSYFAKSIPVTYFSLGYAVDYHQPTDEPQYIDYDHGAKLGRFVHDIAETIANRPTRLTVLPLEQRDMSARCGQ